MTKKILRLLLVTLLSLSLCACGQSERYDLLYSKDVGTLTYSVRGTGFRAKQITVKEGDTLLFARKVKTDKAVGSQGGDYGLLLDDLNFDGENDVAIATEVAGDALVYECFLYNATNKTYERSKELSGLGNIKADKTLQAIFSFAQSSVITKAPSSDLPDIVTSTDSATKYLWKNGVLTPEMRLSSIYYSETNRYCYRVEYYDEEEKALEIDMEKWFTPEEYKAVDWGFLYYYK